MTLQDRVLESTLAAVAALKPAKVAINAAIYAVCAGVFYVFIGGAIDVVLILACIGGGLLYSLIRDVFTHRRAKAALAGHLAYVRAKHPQLDLYVPMLDKVGRTVLLKRAGLFFEDGELALEAFHQPAFAKSPKDSITVPCGVDFKIREAMPEAAVPLVVFRSELMNNRYRFHVVKDDEVIARISAFAQTPEPAASEAPAIIERNE